MPDTNVELIIDVEIAELVIVAAVETASATRFANDPASGIRSSRLQIFPESLISGWVKWFYWNRSVSFT